MHPAMSEQDRLAERYVALFGRDHDRPAPLPTCEHLEPADLRFAVLADIHAHDPERPGMWWGDNARIEEAIRQINALEPEFVIHLGDNVMGWPFDPSIYDPAAREAVRLLNGLACPVYQVAGTHDVGVQHRHTAFPGNICTPENCRVYKSYFGEDHYSFDVKGYRFIVLNNQLCNSGYPEENAQEQWFRGELERGAQAKLVFVLVHVPLFWLSPDEHGDAENWDTLQEPARSRHLALLERHKVAVVYSGHVEFGFGNEWRGIHMRTLNSPTRTRDFLESFGAPATMTMEEQFYDPYKRGFLLVRVRKGQVHESWVPTYWPVESPPAELQNLHGKRLIARPATEVRDGILGIAAPPPVPVRGQAPASCAERGLCRREIIHDRWWRLAEDIGSRWLQTRGPCETDQDWQALRRGLTLGHPRAVRIAVQLPFERNDIKAAWSKLNGDGSHVDAILVCNGAWDCRGDAERLALSRWREQGDLQQWVDACRTYRTLASADARIVLARLPLEGPEALDRIASTASALEGHADALAVWVCTEEAPEAVWGELSAAADRTHSHNLELWVDLAAWQTVDEPQRSAYVLRLLALCQARGGIRLFWWNGPQDRAGVLDGCYNLTPLCYAAQSWQAVVDGPGKGKSATMDLRSDVHLAWQDRDGKTYTVWWDATAHMVMSHVSRELKFPPGSVVFDPLHGRIVETASLDGVPVCSWPLVAKTTRAMPAGDGGDF